MKKKIQYTSQLMLFIISVTANATAVYHVANGTVAYTAEHDINHKEED